MKPQVLTPRLWARPAGGIIQRHDQVFFGLGAGQPAMRRAVLEQQHPRQRTPLTLLAVLAPQCRLAHQPGRLQRQPRDRVAKRVVVLADQRLVKVPDREVSITISKQPAHPPDLGRVSRPGRALPKPAVTQSRLALIIKPDAQAAELTTRHAEQFASFISAQTPAPKTL